MRTLPASTHPEVLLAALAEAFSGGQALFIAPTQATPTPVPEKVPEKVAVVVQTSGTTGHPKLVALTSAAVRSSAAASLEALGPIKQWVLALPASAIAGVNMFARSLGLSVPVRLPEGSFSAAGFVSAVKKLVSVPDSATALVPTQLRILLAEAESRQVLAGFRAVLVGGQNVSAALRERAELSGIRLVCSYGASETSGGCVYNGRPLGNTRIRVVDGEIRLAGAMLALGYLGEEALNRERFIYQDGVRWFRTADTGSWDTETLQVGGRRDAVLNSGGVKIALAAIEAKIQEFLELNDAVVLSVPDRYWGERPVAFSCARKVDEAGVLRAVRESLGPAAQPIKIVLLAEMPLLPSGKPDRQALQKLVVEKL